jgi:hypothetical protein
MELKNLIDVHLDLPRLSKDLDELGHSARVWAMRQWERGTQARVWEAARGFRPVTLDDCVPASVPPLVEVCAWGTNTLPIHTAFQKRFCRPTALDAKDRRVGYNHQSLSAFSGPGYYVAHPAADAGEVDIDYTMVPTEKPPTWPSIAPNSARLGRFIYYGVVDVMRGISSHVSIGRAKKKNEWIDAWFVLVREDPPPAS